MSSWACDSAIGSKLESLVLLSFLMNFSAWMTSFYNLPFVKSGEVLRGDHITVQALVSNIPYGNSQDLVT